MAGSPIRSASMTRWHRSSRSPSQSTFGAFDRSARIRPRSTRARAEDRLKSATWRTPFGALRARQIRGCREFADQLAAFPAKPFDPKLRPEFDGLEEVAVRRPETAEVALSRDEDLNLLAHPRDAVQANSSSSPGRISAPQSWAITVPFRSRSAGR